MNRSDRIDALRGLAMVWMAVFHVCFDLNQMGWLHPPQRFLSDPFWTLQRTCIVSLFLLCLGMGQALALERALPAQRFWRRWAQVALCALAVSAGSWWFEPRTWISFGVLHGMAVMLLILHATLGWLRARGVAWMLALGAVAMLAPAGWRLWQNPALDSRWTNGLGLVSRLPVTADYAPVLPWIGVVLWGAAAAFWLLRQRPAWLSGPLPKAFGPLAWLGRWPLRFYMLHQPVALGLLWVLERLLAPGVLH